jgi:DNA-binding transcriptional MerR regulator
MSSPGGDIEIPKRALFKASEVCELAKVQPYVLRSWESEFQDLGVAKTAGGPRVYRREDVEQVLRIKHLLLVEGLTLAGARRKLEEEAAPVAADAPAIDELLGVHARERLTEVKRGLMAILEMLNGKPEAGREFRLTPGGAGRSAPAKGRPASRPAPAPAARHAAKKTGSASARKKRSA